MSSFDISKYTGAAVLLSLQRFCKLINAASSCANYFRLLLVNERRLSRKTYQLRSNVRLFGKLRIGKMSLSLSLSFSRARALSCKMDLRIYQIAWITLNLFIYFSL